MRFLAFALVLAMQTSSPGPRIVDRGDQSGVDDAKQVVVKTPQEWTALWRLHGMDRPLPKVDFAHSTIVALFMGSRPTAGFRIEIVRVDEEAGTQVVRYRETMPRSDMMTAQVLTSPYVIAAIARTEGDVRFEKIQ